MNGYSITLDEKEYLVLETIKDTEGAEYYFTEVITDTEALDEFYILKNKDNIYEVLTDDKVVAALYQKFRPLLEKDINALLKKGEE